MGKARRKAGLRYARRTQCRNARTWQKAFKREEQKAEARRSQILYKPSSEEVFRAIIPEYVAGIVYGAVCESVASELAARRTAMDAATKNAGEMIDHLNLYYNRARQAAITQEITEIVAGAEN